MTDETLLNLNTCFYKNYSFLFPEFSLDLIKSDKLLLEKANLVAHKVQIDKNRL